jgi:hypothetical protein
MLPPIEILHDKLYELFREKGFSTLEIISRSPAQSSTFPTELLECNIDNRFFRFFCKYQDGMSANNFGHRGAVSYEAMVYDKILSQSPLPSVGYYGQCTLSKQNEMFIILDYVQDPKKMTHVDDGMEKAIKWIARFHSYHQGYFNPEMSIYTPSYYSVWRLKLELALKQQIEQFPWLPDLFNYYEKNVSCMVHSPFVTVIHGEYYPVNVIAHEDTVYPIDWESAAIGTGEIDLASLIDGWDEENIEKYVELYTANRWPDGNYCYEDFRNRLLMAQLYFHFRWLSSNPLKESLSSRYQDLFEISKKIESVGAATNA